jgi:hypothetical protein
VIRASPIAPSEILAPAKLVAGAATSQRFQQMVVGVCDLMSVPDTDGVVVVNSANPTRLFGQQVGGSLEVAANHFAVVTNRRTMEAVYRWLTGVNPAPEGTQ